MEPVYLIFGIALLLLGATDALWTTLWVDGGAGPLSSRISTLLWRAILAAAGHRHHKALSLFGPFFLIFGLLMWAGLLWAGWVFVFAGSDSALQHSTDHTPADWVGRIYFVGYMMFTAGNGDYKPYGDAWQLVSAATNASGMIMITLEITYLLSVVSAVVSKRALASDVAGLGKTPQDLLLTGWNGQDFRSLDQSLGSIASSLSALSQQYDAFPLLQYYHAARAPRSPIVAVAILDEALTILRHGVPEEARPNPALLHAARASVDSFLETMPGAFIDKAPHPPETPDRARLADNGVPLVDSNRFAAAVADLSDRRRMLLGGVRDDGWTWRDVTG